MPIFEIECNGCGRIGEVLSISTSQPITCPECGSADVRKLLSATSTLTGKSGGRMPGPKDTACCGSSPAKANCAGPGSCCGKGPL